MKSYQRGRYAEEKARIYLEQKGLKTVTQNYRTKRGEIDLIMQDRDITVFVEVRARQENSILDPVETIDPGKCSRIIQSSQHYLQKCKGTYSTICRFDVVLLDGPPETARIEWIKNAFEA